MNPPINVLFIEDNHGDARLVKEELQSATTKTAVRLEWVDRLEKGLQRMLANPVDAVLLDLSLPDSEGLDTLQRVLVHAPQTPVIVMTGQADEETAMQAVQSGAQDYLIKGEVDGRLLARIFAVVDVWDALRSDRPYRKAWSDEEALTYIQEQAGAHFEPQVVEFFLKVIK